LLEELCAQRVVEKISMCLPEMEKNVEGVFLSNNKGKSQSFNSFGKKKFPLFHIARKILI